MAKIKTKEKDIVTTMDTEDEREEHWYALKNFGEKLTKAQITLLEVSISKKTEASKKARWDIASYSSENIDDIISGMLQFDSQKKPMLIILPENTVRAMALTKILLMTYEWFHILEFPNKKKVNWHFIDKNGITLDMS